jgi:CheY-like chemotaxis protein
MRCATPKRGGVVIGCRRRGGELEIAVYDTGPGIAEDQRQEMYTEFSRLDKDSPWGEKGLGLGLSICDRLGRLMRHQLTFASRPGRGSAFGVRVPRDARPRRVRRIEAIAPATDPIGLRGLRVLCVDNDRSILDGMEALLGQWGVQVLKAASAAEAMQCCNPSRPSTPYWPITISATASTESSCCGVCATASDRRRPPR